MTAENSHFSRFKPPLQNATSESFSGPLSYSGKNGFLLRKMRFPRSVWYGFACPILPYGGVFGTEDSSAAEPRRSLRTSAPVLADRA